MAIVRYLDGNTEHPTAHRIHQDLLRDHPTLSFTTVYRTLQTLVAIGEVLALDVGGDRRHYDPNTHCRVHVVCSVCERIEDVLDPDLAVPPPPVWVRDAYGETRAQVQYHGVCAACAARRPSRTSSDGTEVV